MKLLNRKKFNPLEPIYTGNKYSDEIEFQIFKYNSTEFNENLEFPVHELTSIADDGDTHWISIHGIHDAKLIKQVSDILGIHQLAIQDILDTNQRPKFQEYDRYCFFTLKSIITDAEDNIIPEQLSFIIGKNYIISFQERKADYFDHIQHRLRDKIGIVRERGADFLLYLMLEAILDNYFKTLNNVENIIKDIDLIDSVNNLSPEILNKIERYKREVYQIKKTIIPIKDFASVIERDSLDVIDQINIKYFLEIKDLCLTLIDDCDQFAFRLESNVNLFFSLQGHKMNQVMKTLTVVATIFIPLTFVAGVYGMNFVNMPELTWKWGYSAVWGVMLLMFAVMIFYFKKKKWF